MKKVAKAVKNPGKALRYGQRKAGLADFQRKMGRSVFGVDRPFSQYAAGQLAVKRSQMRSNGVQSGTHDHGEQLRRDGVLDLGRSYDEEITGFHVLVLSSADKIPSHSRRFCQ